MEPPIEPTANVASTQRNNVGHTVSLLFVGDQIDKGNFLV